MRDKLKGAKIVVSRAEQQATDFIKRINHIGGEAIPFPLIKLTGISDSPEITKAFEQLESYDWIVFTSANAVEFFFEVADKFGVKFYFYPDLKIATVGEKTKLKLEQLGYRTNFVPIQYTAEVLAENMDPEIEGKRILIPRSVKASDEYIKVFEKRGAIPTSMDIYYNDEVSYTQEEVENLYNKQADYYTFTSGSMVEAMDKYIKKYNIPFNDKPWVCIGPSTAKKAEELGYKIAAVADPHTTDQMLEEIIKLETNV